MADEENLQPFPPGTVVQFTKVGRDQGPGADERRPLPGVVLKIDTHGIFVRRIHGGRFITTRLSLVYYEVNEIPGPQGTSGLMGQWLKTHQYDERDFGRLITQSGLLEDAAELDRLLASVARGESISKNSLLVLMRACDNQDVLYQLIKSGSASTVETWEAAISRLTKQRPLVWATKRTVNQELPDRHHRAKLISVCTAFLETIVPRLTPSSIATLRTWREAGKARKCPPEIDAPFARLLEARAA